jgi:hypothetical protein
MIFNSIQSHITLKYRILTNQPTNNQQFYQSILFIYYRQTSMTRISILAIAGIACLLATSVSARPEGTSSKNITTSLGTPEVCQFPFFYNGRWWYGCISTNDAPDKPMCVLKPQYTPPPPMNNWLYCDMSTFQSVYIMVGGTKHVCLQEKYEKNNVTSASCSSDSSSSQSFQCRIKADEPPVTGSCSILKSQLDSGYDASKAVVQGSTSGTDDTNSKVSGSINVGAISGVVGGCVLVGLLAGLFVYRRRQSRQSLAWQYQDKSSGQMETAPVGNGFNIAAATAAAEYRESASSSQIFLPISPGERMYPVISTYTPTLGDELEIQPGDKVSILIEYDDGWCQGINHTRGGLKGVFPRHCVDMTAGVPVDESMRTTNTSAASSNA